MFVDNGSPWGDASGRHSTRLRVWLFKLGVALIYSTPHHPRSRGKNKRFHRTLSDEVFALRTFQSLETAQYALDARREIYNFARAARSHRPRRSGRPLPASPRPCPAKLPEFNYGADEIVRTVPSSEDYIRFRDRFWKVPGAFRGERVAIRPTPQTDATASSSPPTTSPPST